MACSFAVVCRGVFCGANVGCTAPCRRSDQGPLAWQCFSCTLLNARPGRPSVLLISTHPVPWPRHHNALSAAPGTHVHRRAPACATPCAWAFNCCCSRASCAACNTACWIASGRGSRHTSRFKDRLPAHFKGCSLEVAGDEGAERLQTRLSANVADMRDAAKLRRAVRDHTNKCGALQ